MEKEFCDPCSSQQAAVRHQSYRCLSGAFRAGSKKEEVHQEHLSAALPILYFKSLIIALADMIILLSALIVNSIFYFCKLSQI